MKEPLSKQLWNRPVILIFALPALGYLGFLSQSVFGKAAGLLQILLQALLLFTRPVMALYSSLLEWTIWRLVEPREGVGTIGFLVFAYGLAVVIVWAARLGIRYFR